MEFFKSNINLGEIFVQLLAFVIVFWTLKSLAWKQLLKALDERRNRIKNEFDKIEAAKMEIEQLRVEYANHLRKIDEEARLKLQETVSAGKQISREIQEEARRNAREILEKAKEDVKLEVAKARVVLRDEIAGLVVSATERLLERKMDAEKDKEMVLGFIDHLKEAK